MPCCCAFVCDVSRSGFLFSRQTWRLYALESVASRHRNQASLPQDRLFPLQAYKQHVHAGIRASDSRFQSISIDWSWSCFKRPSSTTSWLLCRRGSKRDSLGHALSLFTHAHTCARLDSTHTHVMCVCVCCRASDRKERPFRWRPASDQSIRQTNKHMCVRDRPSTAKHVM